MLNKLFHSRICVFFCGFCFLFAFLFVLPPKKKWKIFKCHILHPYQLVFVVVVVVNNNANYNHLQVKDNFLHFEDKYIKSSTIIIHHMTPLCSLWYISLHFYIYTYINILIIYIYIHTYIDKYIYIYVSINYLRKPAKEE